MTYTLRLFIAAQLPAAARDRATSLERELQAAASPGWRWSAPTAIHLTLRFLGQTPPERVPDAAAAMVRAAAAAAPLRLSLATVGTFGGRRPRVLWLGLAGEMERLHALADSLNLELASAGWEAPLRGLRPHITLARTRRTASAAERQAVRELAARAKPDYEPFEINTLNLIQSELKPDGAQHSTIHSAALGADVE